MRVYSSQLTLFQTMFPAQLAVLTLVFCVLVFLLKLLYSGVKRTRRLQFLRGPPSPSFLLGHEFALSHQPEVCELEAKWCREYGSAVRVAGCLGEDILLIADPQALHHILHVSGYRYPKPKYFQQGNKRLFGRGILWAEGNVHQRHRKVLNPSFSTSHLRQFHSVFEKSTRHLIEKWDEILDGGCKVINVANWLPRVTLDIIGESAFDFKFGALDNETNELSTALKNIFIDSRARTKADILFQTLRLALPGFLSSYLRLQTREDRRFSHYLDTSKRYAKAVLAEDAISGEKEYERKDVLSVLVRSNGQEDPKKRLDDDEVLSQMSTIILAGHETTSSALTWLLYELARHPPDQLKVRNEMASARARRANGQLTANDYDSMHHLNAIIKEGLRLYPVSPLLVREANEDDVIPLFTPIMTPSGESIAQIPIRKGQKVHIAIPVHNKLSSVYGDDANDWNPRRFENLKKKANGTGGIESSANLMTFSSGVRSCIGWQFAVMELQSILGGLIEVYEFSLPPEGLDVLQVPAGTISPMVRGKLHEGIQMPLRIRRMDSAQSPST